MSNILTLRHKNRNCKCISISLCHTGIFSNEMNAIQINLSPYRINPSQIQHCFSVPFHRIISKFGKYNPPPPLLFNFHTPTGPTHVVRGRIMTRYSLSLFDWLTEVTEGQRLRDRRLGTAESASLGEPWSWVEIWQKQLYDFRNVIFNLLNAVLAVISL